LAFECLQHLVNRFWLNNLASMHNHRTLFNMDISGGMPAVVIKMLVASEPGEISLLPALPAKFNEGSIEGVLCRGQVEIKKLAWSESGMTVSLLSKKDQDVKILVPSEIRGISVLDGKGTIEDTGDKQSRMVSLPGDVLVTIQIDLQ
jgi:hypothetical protein